MPSDQSCKSNRTRWLICLALAAATIGVYCRAGKFDFINFDDPDYVTENPIVRAGLTFRGLGWAFTHCYADNWHPLTWISHMLDCQLFGLNPAGPHLVNVALHAANSVLLFLLLHRMTGAQWRSAMVAALFALHPLHIESVAWISERKDVLSTFLALLSLLAYVRYAKELKVQSPKSKVWFAVALMLFALGLMAKPMLVTLPFLMLLLDFWPLQRVKSLQTQDTNAEIGVTQCATRNTQMLLLEKAPFVILSLASSAITFYAQKTGGALVGTDYFPFSWRLENAVISYFRYFLKACWPVHLSVLYPLEHPQSVRLLLAAIGFLAVVSLSALAAIKRQPFLLVGWLWFLGLLVPVIGLVQVGAQAMADRYTYLPLTGLFIAGVWGISDLLRLTRAPAFLGIAAAAVVLAGITAGTVFQLPDWRNSFTLFSHALDVTRNNAPASNNMGTALAAIGRTDEALPYYAEAVRIEPGQSRYQNNLATALARAGQRDAAMQHYLEAIHVDPHYAEPYNNLGAMLLARHQVDEAISNLNEAIRLDPDDGDARNNLGSAYLAAGRLDDALAQYAEALRLNPTNASAHLNAGLALLKANRADDAMAQFTEAVRLNPTSAHARYEFGQQLFLRGQIKAAREQLIEAARLKPDDASAQFYLGIACLELNETAGGMKALEAAERLRPDWASPLNAEAWVLATSADDHVRNGVEALRLAERAAELTSRQQPAILNTLAAAYAETGRFSEAIGTATQAAEIAQQVGPTNLIPKIRQALELYQSGRAFREKSSGDK